jgi:hypothetical protein
VTIARDWRLGDEAVRLCAGGSPGPSFVWAWGELKVPSHVLGGGRIYAGECLVLVAYLRDDVSLVRPRLGMGSLCKVALLFRSWCRSRFMGSPPWWLVVKTARFWVGRDARRAGRHEDLQSSGDAGASRILGDGRVCLDCRADAHVGVVAFGVAAQRDGPLPAA